MDEYVSATKGADAINGMVSGEIQVSLIGPEGLVAKSKGVDVVGIGAYFDRSVWGVVSSPDVTDWSQLKGKTIALGSLSDITRVVFDQLAAADWVRDPANREDAVARVSRLMEEPDTDAVRQMLEFYFPPDGSATSYLPAGFRHEPQTFTRTVQEYQELGQLTSPVSEADYMDYSYAEKAVADRD